MEAEVVDEVQRTPLSRFNRSGGDDNSWSPQFYGELEAEVDLSPVAVVQVQIFSNWGHFSRQVGLTEVQFLDENRQKLLIESARPGGSGLLENEKGNLRNLFNGKTKTVKEKFMWSCGLPANAQPIELLFFVRILDVRLKTQAVRWMGIWNFNNGLKDLDTGAKEVRITVNGAVSFEGIFEKGCGNQVFEYGQFILLDGPSHPKPELNYLLSAHRDQMMKKNSSGRGKDCDDYYVSERQLSILSRAGLSPTSTLNFGSPVKSNIDSDEQPKRELHRPSWLDEFKCLNKDSEQRTPMFMVKDHKGNLKETFENPGKEESVRITSSFFTCHVESSLTKPIGLNRKISLDDGHMRRSTSSEESLSMITDRQSPLRESSAMFGRRAISASSASFSHTGNIPMRGTAESGDVSVLENPASSLLRFKDAMKKDRDFIIPELPQGRELVVNILSTWGDRHYVGLNGLELFASSGMSIAISRIFAEPADINVLPEYSKDPRVVSNLINGVYRTKDDANLWLAPFTPGKDHFIYVSFDKRVKVALIRVWNYNKSRIHSYRGARYIEMTLDGQCIFKGEIAKSCGAIIGETDAFGDTILFTLDDHILECIASNDTNFFAHQAMDDLNTCGDAIYRPPTGTCETSSQRPHTTAAIQSANDDGEEEHFASVGISGKYLELCLYSNWGDASYIGLTAVEVVGENEETLDLENCAVVSLRESPIQDTFSEKNADQLLRRLYDGRNVTTDVQHMWVTSFVNTPITICITLEDRQPLTGLRLWNYNASLEESYCGVQFLVVKIDGQLISPSTDGYLVRRAPGNCHFDFNQYLSFTATSVYRETGLNSLSENLRKSSFSSSPLSCQEYESLVMPKGFVFQLQLLSTWGDCYYVGLNGLEMYDALGNMVVLSESEVAAYPDSVNVLEGITDDVRTPDKLVDGVNDTSDGRHTWLSPILPGIINRVYVIFDYPVTVSMIKLWNYAKKPCRGVKEFAVVVDDLLVYHGVLTKNRSIVSHQTVLFTADAKILHKEKQMAIRNEGIGQDVQMTNDSQVVHKSQSNDPIDQTLRPFTSLAPKIFSKGFIHCP